MKNNMKKVLTVAMLSASILGVVGCSTTKDNNSKQAETTQTTKKEVVYKNLAKDGSFVVTKDKKVIPTSEVPKDAIFVDWYLDPYCPACVKLETLLSEKTDELYQDNVYIRYHVLSFLDSETQTEDSTEGYSVKSAAYINAVVEVAPEKSVDFLNKVLSLDFRPDDGLKEKSEYKKAFMEVKGTEEEWKSVEKLYKGLVKHNKKQTAKTFNDSKLSQRSSSGELFVPFILIGPDNKALDFETSSDSVQYLFDKINEYKNTYTKEKADEAKEKAEKEAKEKAEAKKETTKSTTKKE